MEFKDRLKQLRKERDLSQQALADAVFVSRSAVAKWEAGLGLPSWDSMQVLADYFGLPVEQLSTSEPETVILNKNRMILTQKRVIVSAAVLFGMILLLCILSIPSVDHVETAARNGPVSPALQTQYCAFTAEYTGPYAQVNAGREVKVTVKNLWGSWTLHLLPVYRICSGSVPRAGHDIWSAELRILRSWPDENFFTHLCNLKIQDIVLQLDTNDTVVLSHEITAYYIWKNQRRSLPISPHMEPDDLRFMEVYDFGDGAEIDLTWFAGTSPSVKNTDQAEDAIYTWQYTLCLRDKEILICDESIQRSFIVNAS